MAVIGNQKVEQELIILMKIFLSVEVNNKQKL